MALGPSDNQSKDAPVIIIGTGLSGYTLGKEYRKINGDKPLVYLTKDDGHSYSKPMLSTGFTKNKSADQLAMVSAGKMAEQLDATIRTFTEVRHIDPQSKTVQLGANESIVYDQLVLAMGAKVIDPPITGTAKEQVLTVNDLMDYRRFREQLAGKKKVVIIGAGLIGCEFANDLVNGGFSVQVVDPMPQVLPALLPEPCAMAVQKGLEAIGAQFLLGTKVDAVNHADSGFEVNLSNGQTLSADLVISAIGLRPDIQLAQSAGLAVNRGIQVNRQLRTSDPDIYALGDCAEVGGLVLLYVLPLMAASRALAKTLAGQVTDVLYPAMPVTIKTPACPVVVAPPPAQAVGQWQIEAKGLDVKALFLDSNSQAPVGFALTGACVAEKQALTRQLPQLLV